MNTLLTSAKKKLADGVLEDRAVALLQRVSQVGPVGPADPGDVGVQLRAEGPVAAAAVYLGDQLGGRLSVRAPLRDAVVGHEGGDAVRVGLRLAYQKNLRLHHVAHFCLPVSSRG